MGMEVRLRPAAAARRFWAVTHRPRPFSFPATSTLAISALATGIGDTSGRSMTGLAIRIDAMKLHGICSVTGIVSAQTAPVGSINVPMANRAGTLSAYNLIRFPHFRQFPQSAPTIIQHSALRHDNPSVWHVAMTRRADPTLQPLSVHPRFWQLAQLMQVAVTVCTSGGGFEMASTRARSHST